MMVYGMCVCVCDPFPRPKDPRLVRPSVIGPRSSPLSSLTFLVWRLLPALYASSTFRLSTGSRETLPLGPANSLPITMP